MVHNDFGRGIFDTIPKKAAGKGEAEKDDA